MNCNRWEFIAAPTLAKALAGDYVARLSRFWRRIA
jgi:hypothetical protein